jgi:hypothetical protein
MAQSDATQSAAQEAPDGALGEIIVTAQKRESKIEKTSVALTVLDGALIADQGIREIKGINAIVPGMTMNESPRRPHRDRHSRRQHLGRQPAFRAVRRPVHRRHLSPAPAAIS